MRKGAEFFQKLRDCGIPRIALENPVPHGYALEYMGQYSQIIQPWQFGHTENKKTALWLFGLPLLRETNNVKYLMKNMSKKDTDKTHYMSPGKDDLSFLKVSQMQWPINGGNYINSLKLNSHLNWRLYLKLDFQLPYQLRMKLRWQSHIMPYSRLGWVLNSHWEKDSE